MLYEEIIKKLKGQLSVKRLNHSLGVSQTAVNLAERFGADVTKAKIAGILHDCAKEITNDDLFLMADAFGIVIDTYEKAVPVLLHAKIGAHLAEVEYGIKDKEIQTAIALHTVGGPEMTLLDKIIYLADFIEPGRSFSGVDTLRNLARQASINEVIMAAYDQSITFIVKSKGLLHPATVNGRNSLVLQLREERCEN